MVGGYPSGEIKFQGMKFFSTTLGIETFFGRFESYLRSIKERDKSPHIKNRKVWCKKMFLKCIVSTSLEVNYDDSIYSAVIASDMWTYACWK